MSRLKNLAFFVLLLLLLSVWSEARPISQSPADRNDRIESLRALLMERTKALKTGADGHGKVGGQYEYSKRVSPGGPDPKHHSKNLSK